MPSASVSGVARMRRGNVAGCVRDRSVEAGVGRDIGDGQLLAGRERVARDARGRIHLQPDHVAAGRPGAGEEDEAVGDRVVDRDRGRLRIEHDRRGREDRGEEVVVGGRIDPLGRVQAARDGGERQ